VVGDDEIGYRRNDEGITLARGGGVGGVDDVRGEGGSGAEVSKRTDGQTDNVM
jgi:hypothetical protein